jgi:acyl-CoA synthetase (AMP-forming)/AMP-acid ligase II
MTDWNYADAWEAVAEVHPEATAIVHGDRRVTWASFEERAEGLARWLTARGLDHQDKVALYLYNSPEYLETLFAAFKVSLVPVNTNYRYAERELAYLWDNADASAVVFHGSFVERIEGLLADLSKVRVWLWVDDGSGPCPSWAVPYEQAVTEGHGEARPDPKRSGDDLLFLYTGGTTGSPKGVMWRQDDLFARLNTGGFRHYPPDGDMDAVREELAKGPGHVLLPACPLMHGTGCFTALESLSEAGTVVLLTGRSLDPPEVWDAVDARGVNALVIVGDPFARPLLAALEREPGRWKLTSLLAIISSGAMWSEDIKRGLLRHHPGMLLVDAFSSSEALGMGNSVSSADGARHTAEFTLGPEVRVLRPDDDSEVTPGSGEVGVLALGGRNPLGYYKDPKKSDATFRVVDGVRYSIPGDFAEVNEDGTIHLLGRGSVCINTAGEKVYPEEVEEVLKTYAGVHDAVVVGVPDERFGEQIVGVVELEGSTEIEEVALIEHVKGELASYKAPKRVRMVTTIGRSPSGKVDYGRHRREAAEWVAAGGSVTE